MLMMMTKFDMIKIVVVKAVAIAPVVADGECLSGAASLSTDNTAISRLSEAA